MSRYNFTVNMYDVLARIAQHLGVKKNVDIAKHLGVDSQVCSNWKKRNTVPWDVLLRFAQENNISLDWLLTGKEPTPSQAESLNPIPENPLNNVLPDRMTGLEKRFDEQKARIDDLAFHIKSLTETISEAFPALHKQVSVLQTETEEMRSALKEVGRTKDLEILGTIGGKG